MVLHVDNATPDTAKGTIGYLRANRLTRALHPCFSPDLAPSDFYRLGKPKMALIVAAFADDELLARCDGGAQRDLARRV
jgi:hypothetical protein